MDGLEANENGKKARMNLKKREDGGGRKRRGGKRKKEVETLHTGRQKVNGTAEPRGGSKGAALRRRGGGAAPHSAT